MNSQVQEIKEHISIADVVGQYVKLERAGRSLRARCPFHKEKTPSFFVSSERGTYICFGCGEKGDIFSFLQKIEGINFSEALRQLAERAGVTLQQQTIRSPEEKNKDERLYAVCESATKYFELILTRRKDIEIYLQGRGVKKETQITWRLGYAPATWEDLSKYLSAEGFSKDEIIESGLAVQSEKKQAEIYDRFRGRIIFPLFDTNGRVIAFSGRFFEKVSGSQEEKDPAKYLNSPETPLFKKSRILYGFDRAKQAIRKADCALLVEGQFDLVLCHQSGLPFTVALSGTALTSEHLFLLSRLSKRLVLALDADLAGLRSGLKSTYMALSEGFDVKIPAFPEGKDPADIAREHPDLLKNTIRNSKTAIEFFLETLHKTARDERTYKKVVEAQILPLIATIKSKIDQAHFISLVAYQLGVPEIAVQEEVGKIVLSQRYEYGEAESVTDSFAEERKGEIELLSHERAAAMILSYYSPTSIEVARVHELLGTQRAAILIKQLPKQKEAESLRFAFDALGEEVEDIVAALLQSIERGVIEEELRFLQKELRNTPLGKSGDEVQSLKRLTTLKRRQEELRK